MTNLIYATYDFIEISYQVLFQMNVGDNDLRALFDQQNQIFKHFLRNNILLR